MGKGKNNFWKQKGFSKKNSFYWLFLHLINKQYFSAMQCKWLIVRIIMAENFWDAGFGMWRTGKRWGWEEMRGSKRRERGR